MLRQLEGSKAVAEAVARCRPGVVCAYPISPQTHIVEELSALVKSGELESCAYLNVESEFAAMSVAIGSTAAGCRTYTATASQGLLFMAEALYNAAGLGLPIVMTVANRAIGAPINIWNDHSDSMSQRDSGWIQLYAEDNQDAVDLHIQAYRLAEELSVPVMVCMDGFVLTHAFEPIDVPEADLVDAWLPEFQPRQVLDPDAPVTIGAMVGPEAFTEVRYLAHQTHLRALDRIPAIGREFSDAFGRRGMDLVQPYFCEDAELVVIALGSMLGTVKDAVDEVRTAGLSVGVLGLTTFRPFPAEALRAALAGVPRVVVLERAFSVGVGGIVSAELAAALDEAAAPAGPTSPTSPAGPTSARQRFTVVAGLGGRTITRASLRALFTAALAGELEPLTFLDLDHDLLRAATEPTGPAPADPGAPAV